MSLNTLEGNKAMFKKIRKATSITILVAFVATSIKMPVFAQTALDLPAPGTMISVSSVFEPALIKGLTVHKDNPFLFDFIVDPGQSKFSKEVLKDESDRMVKYFFAALTIPDKDIWVNLSPYEKDRMVPVSLGQTAMGRDLLAQDYILKQLTASLIYPQKELGKEFWAKVYSKAKEMYGTTQIPVNTFNKVWIVPQKAGVYEHGQTAFIVSGHLKVMLEEDYLSMTKHNAVSNLNGNNTHTIGSQVIHSIILPEIEKEINEGKNFSTLHQIFYAQVLAVWFKRNLKQALLNRVYTNKGTVKGIDQNDAATNEAIYHQYLKAYKKGVFNYIKEDIDPITQETLSRKYFSGGYGDSAQLSIVPAQLSQVDMAAVANDVKVSVFAAQPKDAVMLSRRNFLQVTGAALAGAALTPVSKAAAQAERLLPLVKKSESPSIDEVKRHATVLDAESITKLVTEIQSKLIDVDLQATGEKGTVWVNGIKYDNVVAMAEHKGRLLLSHIETRSTQDAVIQPSIMPYDLEAVEFNTVYEALKNIHSDLIWEISSTSHVIYLNNNWIQKLDLMKKLLGENLDKVLAMLLRKTFIDTRVFGGSKYGASLNAQQVAFLSDDVLMDLDYYRRLSFFSHYNRHSQPAGDTHRTQQYVFYESVRNISDNPRGTYTSLLKSGKHEPDEDIDFSPEPGQMFFVNSKGWGEVKTYVGPSNFTPIRNGDKIRLYVHQDSGPILIWDDRGGLKRKELESLINRPYANQIIDESLDRGLMYEYGGRIHFDREFPTDLKEYRLMGGIDSHVINGLFESNKSFKKVSIIGAPNSVLDILGIARHQRSSKFLEYLQQADKEQKARDAAMASIMNRVKNVIARTTYVKGVQAKKISVKNSLKDLGVEPLDIITALEKEFDKELSVYISDEEAKEWKTVGDVVQYVSEHMIQYIDKHTDAAIMTTLPFKKTGVGLAGGDQKSLYSGKAVTSPNGAIKWWVEVNEVTNAEKGSYSGIEHKGKLTVVKIVSSNKGNNEYYSLATPSAITKFQAEQIALNIYAEHRQDISQFYFELHGLPDHDRRATSAAASVQARILKTVNRTVKDAAMRSRALRNVVLAAAVAGGTALSTPVAAHAQIHADSLNKRILENLLIKAIAAGDKERVKELFDEGIDINFTAYGDDNRGYTPLLEAIRLNNIDMVKWLLSKPNVDVNVKDGLYGFTPLMYAAHFGKLKALRALLESKDIKVNERIGGYTPLQEVTGGEFHQQNIEVAKELLKRKDIDVDAKDEYSGQTPLMMLILIKGDMDFIKLLVENGANVNAQDNQEKTPLVHAYEKLNALTNRPPSVDIFGGAHFGNVDKEKKETTKIIEYLVSHGARTDRVSENRRPKGNQERKFAAVRRLMKKPDAELVNNGGIDLSQQDSALQVTKDVNGGVVVNVNPALIARIEREGMPEVDPVIINMQPADIKALFGVEVPVLVR